MLLVCSQFLPNWEIDWTGPWTLPPPPTPAELERRLVDARYADAGRRLFDLHLSGWQHPLEQRRRSRS